MQKLQVKLVCIICGKRVTLQEDKYVDGIGKVVHTDCHAELILRDNRLHSHAVA